MKKRKKETTINELAIIIKEGFKKADERTDNKIDKLAVMVQKGFNGMDDRFEGVEKRLDGAEGRLENVEGQMKNMASEIDVLQRGQEHIKDRLDEVVYHSEMKVQKRVLENHDRRIKTLEGKALFAR